MSDPAEDKAIIFLATMPNQKSAFNADGDTVTIKLEIPRTYREQGLKMAQMFDKVLEVGIKEH